VLSYCMETLSRSFCHRGMPYPLFVDFGYKLFAMFLLQVCALFKFFTPENKETKHFRGESP